MESKKIELDKPNSILNFTETNEKVKLQIYIPNIQIKTEKIEKQIKISENLIVKGFEYVSTLLRPV